MSYERKVREFYDSATICYESVMGDTWHHGDPEAEARGLSLLEACQVLEDKLLEVSELKAGERAIDFGSGVGGPVLYMAKATGAFFVGLTNNELCNQKARDSAAQAGLGGRASFVTLGDEDYKSLPFPDGCLDAVFFYESVCHLPDKAAFFRESFRVLKPGRRLVGTDWLQRPFGDNQTEEQIMKFMEPVNDLIRIPHHGTVESYRGMLESAGFEVEVARDMFAGVKCFGSTPEEHREPLLNYAGPEFELFRGAKVALDAAREAGVFTVGMFVGHKSPDA